MNPRCLYCNDEILQPVRTNQRFCNTSLGKQCHHKFKSKLRMMQKGKSCKDQARIKFALYNKQIVLESNRKAQKIFKDIKRIIKMDMMPIIIKGKAI